MQDWGAAWERRCRNRKRFDDDAVTAQRSVADRNSFVSGCSADRGCVGVWKEASVESGVARHGTRNSEHHGMSHIAMDSQRLPPGPPLAFRRRRRPAPTLTKLRQECQRARSWNNRSTGARELPITKGYRVASQGAVAVNLGRRGSWRGWMRRGPCDAVPARKSSKAHPLWRIPFDEGTAEQSIELLALSDREGRE
jgi:hypothetical protein